MPKLSARAESFTDSVIRRMTRINNSVPGSINLSQGFPDIDPPIEVLERLSRVALEGPHQYSITFGAPAFCEAIAKKQSSAIGRSLDPMREICVTCGSTEAMMASMMTVCNPGDRVVVFSPFYENYAPDALLSGADPIYFPLTPPEFDFDREALGNVFRDGIKALVLCNPSNPSGKVFTMEELEFIASLAKRYDTFIITDEVYEHIIYDGRKHISMASLPGMAERTLTCNSLSKSYSMTGWRLGYCIGTPEVIEGVKKVHDFLTVGAAAPLQEAAVAGFELPDEYYEELRRVYQERRDFLLEGLDRIGLKHTVPEGTYFILLDISDFLALPEFSGWSDLEFAIWMIKNYGVAAVPGSSFFHEDVGHLIRIHFARDLETLSEALERLGRMCELIH